jgi:hypothetical protein
MTISYDLMKKHSYLLITLFGLLAPVCGIAQHPSFRSAQSRHSEPRSFRETKEMFLEQAASRSMASIYKHQRELTDYWNETSLGWDSANRIQYTYDLRGNLISSTQYDVLMGPVAKYTYHYNPLDQMEEMVTEVYNLNGWEKIYRRLYSYDVAGNQTIEVVQDWDSAGNSWKHTARYWNVYDAENDLVRNTIDVYSPVIQGWELTSGIEITKSYDLNNHLDGRLLVMFQAATGTWDSAFRVHYTNNAQGHRLGATGQYYDIAGAVWFNESKEEYQVDANGKINHILYSAYDEETSEWYTTEQLIDIAWHHWTGDPGTSEYSTYTVQSNNGMGLFVDVFRFSSVAPDTYGSRIVQLFMHDGQAWVPIDRTTRRYDSRGTYVELIYEEYLNNAFEITDQVRRDVSYDANNSIEEVILHEFNFFTRILEPTTRFRFLDYLAFTTGVKPTERTLDFHVYPNPLHSQGTISLDLKEEAEVSIGLYTMLGERLAVILNDRLAQGVHHIPLRVPAAGMYLLRIQAGGKVTSGKLVVTE